MAPLPPHPFENLNKQGGVQGGGPDWVGVERIQGGPSLRLGQPLQHSRPPAQGCLGSLHSTAALQPRAGGAQVGTLSLTFSYHPDALNAGTKRPSFARPRRDILKWGVLPKWDYW